MIIPPLGGAASTIGENRWCLEGGEDGRKAMGVKAVPGGEGGEKKKVADVPAQSRVAVKFYYDMDIGVSSIYKWVAL